MAILTPVKKLFVPNKNMPAFNQPRYGTDMRAIENYINNLATGGISEITSVDGSVIITDPTGPITDLSVPPAGTLFHVSMGNPYNAPTLGGLEGAGPSLPLASFDQTIGSWSSPPFKSTAGGVLISQTNYNVNPFTTGTATLNSGEIIVADATLANAIRITISGVTLPTFGGSYTGWTVSGTIGTQLSLGSPQTTQLIKTTSTTNVYWAFAFYNVTSSGF